MFGEQKTIYDGRLAVSKVKLIQFLDYDLERVSSEDVLDGVGYPPISLVPTDHFPQKHGEEKVAPEYIENMISSVMGKQPPGHVFLQSYWHGDIRVTWGWLYYQIDGNPFGFADADIELYPSKSSKNPFTNVTIKSYYGPRRPYWEWVAKRLRSQFRELHKGGPMETPLSEKRKIVEEWKRKQGKQLKENFCKNKGISVSTLRKWERELSGLD